MFVPHGLRLMDNIHCFDCANGGSACYEASGETLPPSRPTNRHLQSTLYSTKTACEICFTCMFAWRDPWLAVRLMSEFQKCGEMWGIGPGPYKRLALQQKCSQMCRNVQSPKLKSSNIRNMVTAIALRGMPPIAVHFLGYALKYQLETTQKEPPLHVNSNELDTLEECWTRGLFSFQIIMAGQPNPP